MFSLQGCRELGARFSKISRNCRTCEQKLVGVLLFQRLSAFQKRGFHNPDRSCSLLIPNIMQVHISHMPTSTTASLNCLNRPERIVFEWFWELFEHSGPVGAHEISRASSPCHGACDRSNLPSSFCLTPKLQHKFAMFLLLDSKATAQITSRSTDRFPLVATVSCNNAATGPRFLVHGCPVFHSVMIS